MLRPLQLDGRDPGANSSLPEAGERKRHSDAIAALRGVMKMTKQRPVPQPLSLMLKERFPKLLHAVLEEKDLYRGRRWRCEIAPHSWSGGDNDVSRTKAARGACMV